MKSTRNRSRLADQGTKEMLPVIFSLAWPTMLEQLMQTAVQYMDTGMVGVLGTSATAAVGATSTVNWLIGSTISAISIGFLAYISQSIGAGKKEQAKKASGQAVLTVVIVGIFFTILTMGLSRKVPVWMQVDPSIQKLASSYFLILYAPMLFRTANIIFGTVLRAVGDTKTPMQVGVAFNVINIVLNFFLIYSTRTVLIGGKELVIPGAGWGVQGAAAASAIAYTIGGIAITVKLWKHTDISPKGQSFLPDSAVLRPCLKVAVPNMFQRFATSLGYVAFASMINSLGETATAAHTIANTVESAFYIPGYGMQTAAATLAGNALGANDNKKLNSLAKAIVPLEVGLMVISGSLLLIFAPILIRLFSSDYPSGKYGTSYGCCFRTVLWCTYCDRGHDARCGENSNSLYFQCSGNVGCKNSGDFYLHLSSWTGTCVCLGMHDRSQYASFCFIHFTLFQRQMEPYE